MLTQESTHEGRDIISRPAPKRQSRRPIKFMFIDSSNGGVNAKPDRVVRSFVMKSARNRKTWSTRPKSPKEEDLVETHLQRPNITDVHHEPTFATGSWSPQAHRKVSPWDDQALASQASSRTGSVFSACSSSRTCDSPSSSHTSPLVEYSHAEHAYNFPFDQQTATALIDGFDIRFTRPFYCLPVDLDVHAHRLLHQCEHLSTPIPYDC